MPLNRQAADLLAARVGGSAPMSVTFEVTDRCNYRCAHCYQEHEDTDELSLAEIERILRELADLGVLFVTLMGGELFMRRDADDILRIAHELDFALRVKTTGHFITDKRADFLATLRPIQIDLSMYAASSRVHEQVTQQPGSWRRTYEAARRLVARKVPVELKAPAMEANAESLAELRHLAEGLGATYSMDSHITAMESGSQAPVSLRMRWDTLKKFYRDEGSGVASEIRTRHAGTRSAELRALGEPVCGAGSRALGINPQGKVYPCNVLNVAVGDLRRQSVAEVWQSAELEEVRALRWAAIEECNACEVRRYCHRCHAMALHEHGSFRGPSLEACRQAVAVRDSLRDQGLVPETDTALPPTWDRVDRDGQHSSQTERGVRPAGLRVLETS